METFRIESSDCLCFVFCLPPADILHLMEHQVGSNREVQTAPGPGPGPQFLLPLSSLSNHQIPQWLYSFLPLYLGFCGAFCLR